MWIGSHPMTSTLYVASGIKDQITHSWLRLSYVVIQITHSTTRVYSRFLIHEQGFVRLMETDNPLNKCTAKDLKISWRYVTFSLKVLIKLSTVQIVTSNSIKLFFSKNYTFNQISKNMYITHTFIIIIPILDMPVLLRTATRWYTCNHCRHNFRSVQQTKNRSIIWCWIMTIQFSAFSCFSHSTGQSGFLMTFS